MATMANWNGHTFEVSANLIRSFEDLTIKGSCETKDKEKSKQGYVKRKKGQPREVSLNLPLSALLGVTDVYSEANAYVNEANNGAAAYFYIGTKKLIRAKIMLTSAEITEVVTMPGKGHKWISCVVKLTFKQSTKDNEGGSASSSSKKKKKKSVKSSKSSKTSSSKSSTKSGNKSTGNIIKTFATTVAGAIKAAKGVISAAKAASKSKILKPGSAIKKYAAVARKTQTTKTTAQKKTPTTGRAAGGGGTRLMLTR